MEVNKNVCRSDCMLRVNFLYQVTVFIICFSSQIMQLICITFSLCVEWSSSQPPIHHGRRRDRLVAASTHRRL